jgi:hypothetical protein
MLPDDRQLLATSQPMNGLTKQTAAQPAKRT